MIARHTHEISYLKQLKRNFCEQEIPGSIFKKPNSFWAILAFLAISLWILLWVDYVAAKVCGEIVINA